MRLQLQLRVDSSHTRRLTQRQRPKQPVVDCCAAAHACIEQVLSSASRPVALPARSASGCGTCACSGERGKARVLGGVLEAYGLALGARGEGVGAQLALAGGAAEAVHVPHAAHAAVVSLSAQAAKSNAAGRLGHGARAPAAAWARTRARIRTRSPAASCWSPCAWAAAAACATRRR